MKRSALIVIALLIVALIAAGFYLFRRGAGPTVAVSRTAGPVSARQPLVLTLTSPKSGLKELTVTALQGNHAATVVTKRYPSGVHQARESFMLVQSGLKEGPFQLQVSARDRSIAHFGSGNVTAQTFSFVYDNKPPMVAVLSVAHNIARGGSGLVVYSLNKEAEKSGVVFDNQFYPGYQQSGNTYACLFPFPYDMDPNRYIPKVMAVDRAGNERKMGIYYHLLPKAFTTDRIELTDSFLEKVAAEFKDKFPQAGTALEVFLKANGELRVHDSKILRDCGLKTARQPLWKGAFLRFPNSAPRGGYAQVRSYFYHGKKVDQQTHVGIDLASLPHAQVPAANDGTVVYADDLGIYGQCIIIDHGMGLQTLYGHLSQIGVKVGESVQKGQIIGNTGDTGLAGGDHLHFGVNVSGQPVNPIEWWDPSWIKNNFTDKLEEALPPAAAPPVAR